MKKVLFSLLSAAALLCSTSCSDEAVVSPEVGGESLVQFTVELNDGTSASRAISDGSGVNKLYYEVYSVANDGTKTLLPALDNWTNEINDPETITGKTATVGFPLVKGQKYDIVFWAQKDSVYNAQNLQSIAVGTTANNDDLDAFTAVYRIESVEGAQNHKVYLTRPFAQVNFGTTTDDITWAEQAGIKFNNNGVRLQSQITVEDAALTYNALTELPNEDVKNCNAVVFAWNRIPEFTETLLELGEDVNKVTYKYIATAYVLVPTAEQIVANLKMEMETGLNENITLTVPNAPIQRNYRTNVIGNLLTNQTDFTVIVNPIYAGEETVNIWDGKSVAKPEKNEDNDYIITSAEELAWVANLVNGTLPAEARALAPAESLAGVTVKLANDINLANQAWTPIGNASNPFKGTFDGNGKTIHNLNVQMAGDSNAGLFGVTHDGEIKNLTVENATVVARLNVGVVAGQPYTSKYTNITVKGLVQVNGMAYVGAVGGKNAYADWTDVKVEAAEGSYVKANSIENGTAYRTYVGGVVGFNGEGTHTFKNITSNIDVKGSTCDVGGLFGIAHYGNKFENCDCTGNVEITKAEESEEAEEIGGIAGVWHNGGQDVVFTNCEFTGKVTTNVARETVWYDNLFGKPYNNNGAGKLILNGYEMVGNGVGMKDGEYYVFNGYGMRWIASTVNAGTSSFKDKTIKLVNDIDLSGIQWMPIGYGQNRFNGTFDGQGKTITGMTITEYNGQPQAALFGNVALTTTFKNLTISGANVVMPTGHTGDFYAAGLIGTFYGTVTIDNVTVKESTFVGNNKVAGLIAHDGVSSNLSINNCHILDCNISSANTADGGNVGGMVGLFQGAANGEYIIANSSVKNCTIVGINSSNSGKRANAEFVACVNSKANQTLVIENCVVEDNNFSQTINGSDAVTYVGPYDNEFVGGHREVTEPVGIVVINGVQYPNTAVSTWDEFTAALAANKTYIVLTDDITYDANYQLQKDVTIDLYGKSMTLPMINIHKNVTIKNGTINGKVYARINSDIVFDNVKFSGAVADNLSTEGHLAIQGGCKSLYAKDCLFSPTSVSGSQTKPLSFEGGSTIMKFENCEFKSSPYKKQVYFNPLSATAKLDFTNCNFNSKTPNIMFAAACPLTNLTMSGTTKLSSVTLETNRAKDAVTAEDLAYLRESLIANNSMSSVRLFYAGGSSEYIR